MLSARLQKIDVFFDLISQNLPLSLINPIAVPPYRNCRSNPQFEYQHPEMAISGLKQVLEEMHLGTDPIEQILDQKRRELILKISLLESIGTPAFAVHSAALYPPPSTALVATAHRLLALPPAEEDQKILRGEVVRMMKRAFKVLGINWRIASVPMIASARVEPSMRRLELNKRERFGEDYAKRLIIHEIGTHALRGENGRLQPLRVFYHGLSQYLETEEGLAAFNEYIYGLMTNTTLRTYAGRVVAVDYALTHDFLETYRYMRQYFSAPMAHKLAVRAKRGLADTSQPGAFTRDVTYLRGFLAVREFAKRNSTDVLYLGKIGIADLPLVQQVPDLVQPQIQLMTLFASGLIAPSVRSVDGHKVEAIISGTQ